jgi:tRNA threonylcarbamoyl adenosine modification protein YeaZ
MSAVLALEWSTGRLSVALRQGHAVWSDAVEVDRFRSPEAMALLDRLADTAGEAWNHITEVRVGRGPGNYSGIRQAFAWAAGFAAPGGIRITARSSGTVQAMRWLQTESAVWVVGDARRGSWWGSKFEGATTEADWQLATPEVWGEKLQSAFIISAEAARLQDLSGVVADAPTAEDLLRADRLSEEPPEPIYLHPAVG